MPPQMQQPLTTPATPQQAHAFGSVDLVAKAELRIRNAFLALQRVAQKYPHFQFKPATIAAYQRATAAHRLAATTWLNAHKATPRDQLVASGGNPDAVPHFPPQIGELSSTSAGLSAPHTGIPARALFVRFGPLGQERMQPLAGAYVEWPNQANGLGVWQAIVWVALVLITAAVITYFITSTSGERARADIARADADRAQAEAQVAEQLAAEEIQLAERCSAAATTAEQHIACMAAYQDAVHNIQKDSKTELTPAAKSGWSWLEVLGVLAIVGGVGAVGYAFLRYRRRRQAGQDNQVSRADYDGTGMINAGDA